MIIEVIDKAVLCRCRVEVDVPTVPDSESATAGQNDRQIGVAVTVTERHAAAVQRHRRINQRAVGVLHLAQPIEEVAELLDVERVAGGQILHQFRVRVVMRERMPILLHADLWDGWAGPFVAGAERRDASQVGLKREHDDVVHRAEILAEPFQRDVSVQLRLVGRINFGTRRVEPLVGTLGANFDFTNRREILLQPPAIFFAKLAAE